MNKTSVLVKPYLKKFVLQTHPDYFHNEKLKKQVNSTSLQKLYDILQLKAPTQPSCTLQFFVKKTKQPVTYEFDSKDTEWDRVSSFLSLCQRLHIPVSQTDTETVQTEIKNQYKTQRPHKSLSQEFADQLYKQHRVINNEFTPHDILNNPLIMFDTGINRKLSAHKLCQWLPQLQPEIWWNKIPLIVISSDSKVPKDMAKGVLVISDDMELNDIKEYMDQCLTDVINQSYT